MKLIAKHDLKKNSIFPWWAAVEGQSQKEEDSILFSVTLKAREEKMF